MTRVLQVVPQFAVGGGERVAMNLLCNLHRRDHEVKGVCLHARPDSEMARRLDEAGVEVAYLGKGPGFDSRTAGRILEITNQFRPDIIHSHNHVLPYLIPALLLKRAKVAIHTVHSIAEYDATGINRGINKFAFRQLGVIPVAIAYAVGESIQRAYQIDAPLVPNGIVVQEYQESTEVRYRWRTLHGVSADDILFVSIGALWPVKNHRTLLDAFAGIINRIPSARCLIVGSGPLAPDVNRHISALRLQGKAELLGERADVPQILAAADVIVSSSQCEGRPLSIMEAMAAGKMVIATDVGGVPEIVSPETGILVPAGDVNALAKAMLKVGEQETLHLTMGSAARGVAEKCFDISMMTNGYETLYQNCLGRAESYAGLRALGHGASRFIQIRGLLK